VIFDFPGHCLYVLFRVFKPAEEVFVFECEGVGGSVVGDIVILYKVGSAGTSGEAKGGERRDLCPFGSSSTWGSTIGDFDEFGMEETILEEGPFMQQDCG